MADLPPYPGNGEESDDGGSAKSTPSRLWVVGIIIAIGVILVLVALHLTGTFGPGAH